MAGKQGFDNQRTRTLLGVAVVAISILLAVALAGFSSAGTSPAAVGSPANAQYGKPAKVVICHHTKSKTRPLVSISVPVSSVKAHKKHGDTVGRCTAKQIKRAKAKIAAAARKHKK
ncbi:MAG: hypothetical protein QOF71_1742 [Candidatus Eremiobacteraeota bacterium]|jgi:hypothetical protein|nr:hypothetical protein [Candidatus Eremiobacteraeota bacterium]